MRRAVRFAMTILTTTMIPAAMPAGAQVTPLVQAPSGFAPMYAPCARQPDGTCLAVAAAAPLPTAGRQESFALVSANEPAPAQTLFGGVYVVSGICAAYGTGYQLRARAPDGTTMIGVDAPRTAAGSALYSFGGGANVDVQLPAGTSGCNVTIARVPA